ncbi:unnamed protein product [Rotaria sordida]|uniref:C3H1-type domain-containing protein n=1 Tax=Rotaria sordida TaxID=392033 RepID=A0A814ICY3_9BILA|nr:unnamed protein product [Rotaria sordida]
MSLEQGKCNRTNPPCKYLHPPQHLRDILLQNGRNNLILRSIAMNIAANQAMYPQTATHLSYPNGAIIQNPLQQSASIASYPQISSAGPAQSALVFNQAGQAFSIPLHATHLHQITQGTNGTTMYGPDGTQYFQPVTQLTAQPTGPKITRTDRLESYFELDTLYVCSDFQHGQCFYTSDTCPYAHPQAHCPLDADGLVTVCVDYVKGKCSRETCKYFHPPDHLVAQLKAVKAQSVAAAAAHVYSAAATLQYSPSTIQFVHPLTLNSSQQILTAPPTYVYPQQTSIAPVSSSTSSSPLQQQNAPEDDGAYTNGFVSPYQTYQGHIQAIYARAPSADLKDSTLIASTNDTTSSSTTTDIKPPGTQIISAQQYVQQQQTNVPTQHQKRSAVADPKTGIPMAAYPVTAFSYPSPSPLQIPFQQPYLTAVPMTFTGYTSHLPRL